MSRALKTVLLVLIVLGLAVPVGSPVTAQDERWEIRINQFSTLEQPEEMVLKVYFSIFDDRTGTPMLNVDAQSAQVTLLNTNYTSNAELKKPDLPIYITLVMDASGSMGGVAQALKDAAKQALNNPPNDAFFSVVQFDEEIKLLQDFTENLPALTFAIDRYQVSRRGTCLYDATYSAVEAMLKAPVGRRAVILFTDGKDENAQGKPCSKRTYQELVDLAMQSQVPISTIGLSYKQGAINEVELRSMAGSTGGASAIASQDDLGAAFESIMLALKAQWMVEAAVYPRRGSNNAVLSITLKDGLALNKAFTLNSNTDYPGPPSPVKVRFAGLVLNAAEQSYEVQLDMTSPELAGYVKIEVWDEEAGLKVGEFIFENPQAKNRFFVPTEALTIGRKYQLRISAVSKQDNKPFEIVRDDQGRTSTQLVHGFAFDPTSSYPSLQVQSLIQQGGDLLLNVTVTNPDLVGGFDGWLVNVSTNSQVPNSNFRVAPLDGTSGTIVIPARASRIPNGTYHIVVRVLAKNDKVYSTTVYENVAYRAPSLFERLGVALIAAPIFLVAILVIILMVVGFLMWNSSRQKSLSGTPVLQGRLGGKLGGGNKAGGPVIPVADSEPIPGRARPPASTPVASAPPPVSASSQPARPASDATLIYGSGLESAQQAGGGATMIAAAPAMPRATVTVVQAGGGVFAQSSAVVSPLPFVIGRTEGAFIIQEPNISRRHAQISYEPSQNAFFITDLNSSNGTRLNQQRLPSGQPVRLESGAVIGLGPNVLIRFDVS